VWTIFRAEVAHFKTQHIAYRKTGLEWEILAELGLRLHHKEEAKEAFQRCLDAPRYARAPWLKLMELYADEGDLTRTLQTAIRVAAYQYGDYTEMTVRPRGRPEASLTAVRAVSDGDRSVLLQARPGSWPHENRVHAPQHGPARADPQDHGGLPRVRRGLQSRGLRLLIPLFSYICRRALSYSRPRHELPDDVQASAIRECLFQDATQCARDRNAPFMRARGLGGPTSIWLEWPERDVNTPMSMGILSRRSRGARCMRCARGVRGYHAFLTKMQP
jgi:hypothetical protein